MKLKQRILIIPLLLGILETPILTTRKKPFYAYALENIMNTRIGFHLWMYSTRIKHHTTFTFHQIAGDQEQEGLETIKFDTIYIQRDASKKIITIHDGKKTPLILSSIPTKPEHINRLKLMFQSNAHPYKNIGIFSLNKCWECETSGLFALIKNSPELIHYRYPTTDMQAPSFIDTIQAVYDLENRDKLEQCISLVHCKAGRGRSATIVSAYLMHILHKIGLYATPDEIEAYLCTHRPQVHLETTQKEALCYFCNELQIAGNLDNLYKKYLPEINQRIKEINNLLSNQKKRYIPIN